MRQIANDNALTLTTLSAPVHFQYPRSQELAAQIFTKTNRAKKTLSTLATQTDPPVRATVVVPYSTGIDVKPFCVRIRRLGYPTGDHWHELFICFADRVVYHFDGFGNALSDSDDPIVVAFNMTLGQLEWHAHACMVVALGCFARTCAPGDLFRAHCNCSMMASTVVYGYAPAHACEWMSAHAHA